MNGSIIYSNVRHPPPKIQIPITSCSTVFSPDHLGSHIYFSGLHFQVKLCHHLPRAASPRGRIDRTLPLCQAFPLFGKTPGPLGLSGANGIIDKVLLKQSFSQRREWCDVSEGFIGMRWDEWSTSSARVKFCRSDEPWSLAFKGYRSKSFLIPTHSIASSP